MLTIILLKLDFFTVKESKLSRNSFFLHFPDSSAHESKSEVEQLTYNKFIDCSYLVTKLF